MQIKVNNLPVEINSPSTLEQLAQELMLASSGVAVALNRKVIARDLWAQTPLSENDEVIIIKAACGG